MRVRLGKYLRRPSRMGKAPDEELKRSMDQCREDIKRVFGLPDSAFKPEEKPITNRLIRECGR